MKRGIDTSLKGEIFENLPIDVFRYLSSFLSTEDLYLMSEVNFYFKNLLDDDQVWKQQASTKGIFNYCKFNLKMDENISFKAMVKNGYQHIHSIKFPEKLVKLFDSEKSFYEIPMLDYVPDPLREIDISGNSLFYFGSTFSYKEMKGHKIMRGVDCKGAPFLMLCAKSNINKSMFESVEAYRRASENSLFKLAAPEILARLQVIVVYKCDTNIWLIYKNEFGQYCKCGNEDFIRRLIQNQPCGENAFLETQKTLDDGTSILELTDQTEFNQFKLIPADIDDNPNNSNENKCSLEGVLKFNFSLV